MKHLILCFLFAANLLAGSFTVATYNLEFYVNTPTLGEQPKSDQSRAAIRESIRQISPDVIALQEIGSTNALLELRESLQREKLDFPYWQHIRSRDTNLHLAFLSKHPITATRHHTNENFLHQGRRFQVARGFGEIEVEFSNNFRVTFITAHLKSKRQTPEADQQEIREQEAILLREKIDAFLKRDPSGALIVLGDMNDGIDSRTLKTILGRGKTRLFDTRPGETIRPSPTAPHHEPVVWNHYFAKEESYSRIDFILTSPNLKKSYRPGKSRILALPEWRAASDHRPVSAYFEF